MARRKFPYRCRFCGCFLDPGEGDVCTECQEEQEQAEGGGKKVDQGDYGIPASEWLEGEYMATGICPFCGREHDFRCVSLPEEGLLKKWAMQRCDCLEARIWRMEQRAEARKKAGRGTDDTY